jgi:dTDP-4-dehydrorhamnose reductase
MIVVTGATGQLGFELRRLLGDSATFLDRKELDLADTLALNRKIESLKPSLLINAAAYTAVDKAESEPELARKINVEGPTELAKLGQKMGFRLVHISTDYVFDGTASTPYKETDAVHPQGIYGQTKADAEQAILHEQPEALILRTSWVYSSHGKNFVKTVLRIAQEHKVMRVVFDQIGSLTYAKDLAATILQARELSGIYHYSNEGVGSWYDVACAIKKFRNLSMAVEPILSQDYPTPAKRPHYSVLDKTKIKSALKLQIPHWMESLEKCLKEIF